MWAMEKQCVWCDKGWAVIGFAFGAILILVSVDLLTNGRLSALSIKEDGEMLPESESGEE